MARLRPSGENARQLIPGAEHAGVLLHHRRGRFTAGASTGEPAATCDLGQLVEGPALTAMAEQAPVLVADTAAEARWPAFAAAAGQVGIRSVLSIDLTAGDTVLGALNVYARQRDAFTAHAVDLGERFAEPAAVSVHNVQVLHAARTQAAQLQAALKTRAVIDQAIGIVRSRVGGSADEAFDRLRQISQSENVKLAVVAERLVDEAVRRAHARHSQA